MTAGAEDITFDAVSRASGVPLRTVYRHFPNRAALRDAFWGWLNDAIEVPDPPRTPADLPAYGRALFAAFDRQAALVRAFIHTAAGRDIRSAGTAARQEKFRRALAPLLADLSPETGHALLAAVMSLCSASGWENMRAIGEAEAGDVVAWSLAALVDSAPTQGKHR